MSVLLYACKQLALVGEAGDRVDIFRAVVLEVVRRLVDIGKAADFLRRDTGVFKAQREVVDIGARKYDLMHVIAVEHLKVDIPQPRDVAREILAADRVDDNQHVAALFKGGSNAQALVVGHAVLMLGGQQRAVAVTEGKGDDSAVFEHIVAHVGGDFRAVDADDPRDGIGGKNIVDIIQRLERERNAVLAVDLHFAAVEVDGGDGIGGILTSVAAGGALIMTDMVIVIGAVGHRLFADRAICAVVVGALERVGIGGQLVRAEPDDVLPALTKAGHERIIGVEDQLRAVADAVGKRVIDPLGMAVARELVAVEIRDHIVRRLDVAEGIACEALVALNEQDVALDLAAEGGAAENKRGNALDLIGAFAVPRDPLSVLLQDMGDHLDRRGFAVAARDGDDIGGKLHPAEDVGAELERDLSRKAAALADQLADKAQEPADQNGKKDLHSISPIPIFSFYIIGQSSRFCKV